MPQVVLPNLDQYKLTLEPGKWYVLTEPQTRLILAVGESSPGLLSARGRYWIYDPQSRGFETIVDGPQLAWEVDVEIRGI